MKVWPKKTAGKNYPLVNSEYEDRRYYRRLKFSLIVTKGKYIEIGLFNAGSVMSLRLACFENC